MKVFFVTEIGSLGEHMDLEGVPRPGDFVYHPLGAFEVLRVSWWTWGRDSVSLLVRKAESGRPERG
jgi:hypothetical protein